jgi:hypothetical protein
MSTKCTSDCLTQSRVIKFALDPVTMTSRWNLSCGCVVGKPFEWHFDDMGYAAVLHKCKHKLSGTCARKLQPAPPPQLQTPRLGRVV